MRSMWRHKLVLAWMFCSGLPMAVLAAGRWQIPELPLNRSDVAKEWHDSTSWLNRKLRIKHGFIVAYAVEVRPGIQYTLQVTVPHHLQGVRAFLYDRWPLLASARQIELPTGPVMLTPHMKQITYRWRLGVSAHSTGNMLYVVVSSPRDPGKRRGLLPRIELRSPPISPHHHIGRGITYLSGPQNLVLADDSTSVSNRLTPILSARHERVSADVTTINDLVSNGQFRAGLKNWVPVGAALPDKTPSVNAKVLRLPPASGVDQELDADVSDADSLLLQVALRLDPDTDNAHDPVKGPGFAIKLCYRDQQGKAYCGASAYCIAFRMLHATATTTTHACAVIKYPSAGKWYRYQLDLMKMKPLPVHIESLSLLASQRHGTVLVRGVHMFSRRPSHVTR